MQTSSADRLRQEQLKEAAEQLATIKKEMRSYMHIEIIEKVGQGSFGDIFKVWDTKRNRWAAMKFEKKDKKNKYSLIKKEAQIMQTVKGSKYFAVLFDSKFSDSSQYNFIEMSFLGPNLESLKKRMDGKFSQRTVLLIANQMISGLEVLHTKGIIHRDIKPENFVIGCEGQHHQVFVIDFGLSKYYVEDNGKHIEQKSNKGLVGTARYTSVNSHLGLEQSRRDDLESLGYLLLYFIKGHLIWQNLQFKDKDERFKKIAELKQTTSIEQMCEGLQKPFFDFLSAVKSLEFDQEPEYEKYRQFFSSYYSKCYTTPESQSCFDWCPRNCSLYLKQLGKESSSRNISDTVPNGSVNKITKQISDSKPLIEINGSGTNLGISIPMKGKHSNFFANNGNQLGTSNITQEVFFMDKTQILPNLNLNNSNIDGSQVLASAQVSKSPVNDNKYSSQKELKGIQVNKKENVRHHRSKDNQITSTPSDLLAILDKHVSNVVKENQNQKDEEETEELPISEFRRGENKRIPIFTTENNYQKHHQLSPFHKIEYSNNFDLLNSGSAQNIKGTRTEHKIELDLSQTGVKSINMFQLSSPNYLAVQPFSVGNIENKDSSQYVNNCSNEWNSQQDEKVEIQVVFPFNSSHNQQQF